MPRRAASPERYERYDPWASPSSVGVGDRKRLNPYNGFHGDRDEFREVLVGVFRDAGLLDAKAFRLDEGRASRFFDRVFDSYNTVPYHCAFHAQEVTVAAHVLARELRACGHGPFDEDEMLALYVAALGHDVGHFGRTNAYLANSKHALHLLYPTSTLERFHADRVSKLLADPDDGLAPCVPRIADLGGFLAPSANRPRHGRGQAQEHRLRFRSARRRSREKSEPRRHDEATTRGVSGGGQLDPIASTTTNANWRCAHARSAPTYRPCCPPCLAPTSGGTES